MYKTLYMLKTFPPPIAAERTRLINALTSKLDALGGADAHPRLRAFDMIGYFHKRSAQTGPTLVGRKKEDLTTRVRSSFLEQATGIEPAASAWEAEVLPLDYACEQPILYTMRGDLSMPPHTKRKFFHRALRQCYASSKPPNSSRA